ncbi:glycerate kinase type-2 family protein [Kordiimonas sp.]|uniref:glycerate kinase type-2 family protein n=1 Tax=Kordiimonas sp. TaxID=1970157 RepID=UPI003A920A92
MSLETTTPEYKLLHSLFDAGLSRVAPATCLPPHVPEPLIGPLTGPLTGRRTLVLGAGKAAAAMAEAFTGAYQSPCEGLVVTRYGHGIGRSIPGIEVLEASHPVPDSMSMEAARRMLMLAGKLTAKDRLIFLASGGGSSLMSLPAPGLPFGAKQALMKHLLSSGATISEINCVRKHLSGIKGGRLAETAGEAEVLTYVISDVPHDIGCDVASGPTMADPSTLGDAADILARYGAPDLPLINRLLSDPALETVKVNRPRWHSKVIATGFDCLQAAETLAQAQGYEVINLGADLEGDAATTGADHAKLALKLRQDGRRVILLSGGETSVKVTNPSGRGGRNMTYALSLALTLKGAPGIHALACDTDGIDGSEDAAGAYIDATTLHRATEKGLDAKKALDENNSFVFFESIGDLVYTGPTRTNVNDFRAVMITP